MTCEQTRLYLHAYLDDELGVADAIRFEQHLTECAECQTAQRQSLALRTALRGADVRYQPALALSARVKAAVRQAAKPEPQRFDYRPLLALAAMVIAAIGLATLWMGRGESQDRLLARAVVDSHIRSLQAGHLVDVPSSDHHTVKPWFQGKLDFSPPVPDLSAQGWPLEGGRLDYIDGKPVAALVYERRKHQINVFLWPAANHREEPIRSQSLQGYQVIRWTKDGMAWWVTSDINPGELLEFAQLLQMQTAPRKL